MQFEDVNLFFAPPQKKLLFHLYGVHSEMNPTWGGINHMNTLKYFESRYSGTENSHLWLGTI